MNQNKSKKKIGGKKGKEKTKTVKYITKNKNVLIIKISDK